MRIGFVVPGDIDTPTGGYRYDRAVVTNLQKLGHDVALVQLDGNYPFPTSRQMQSDLEVASTPDDLDCIVVDGLAGGAFPELMCKLKQTAPVIALVHHPLHLENGLTETEQENLKNSEAAALAHASAIITTSPSTADIVSSLFDIDRKQIHPVPPGVERGAIASRKSGQPTRLLCVGSIIERKGHRYLVEALANMVDLDWTLTCVGETGFDQNLFETLQRQVTEYGIANRVEFTGAISETELEAIYARSHLFVLPSLYEGYGMAYTEAIIRGLPVIGTNAGAVPDTIPTGCGLLVEPANAGSLREALQRVLIDPSLHDEMRRTCLEKAATFADWRNIAQQFAAILESCQ